MKRDSNAYDNERWELLGWVLSLNGGFLSTVREIPGTKKIRVVTISLHFLLEVRTAAVNPNRLIFTKRGLFFFFLAKFD